MENDNLFKSYASVANACVELFTNKKCDLAIRDCRIEIEAISPIEYSIFLTEDGERREYIPTNEVLPQTNCEKLSELIIATVVFLYRMCSIKEIEILDHISPYEFAYCYIVYNMAEGLLKANNV